MGLLEDMESRAASRKSAGITNPSDPVSNYDPTAEMSREDKFLAKHGEHLTPNEREQVAHHGKIMVYGPELTDGPIGGSPEWVTPEEYKARGYGRKWCFVATVIYLSATAPQLEALRDYRDNVMMRNSVGRAVVSFYYSPTGARVQKFVATQLPSTHGLIRRSLDGLAHYHETHRSA